jgi:phosphoribosylanthranilate isomerase
MRAVPGPSSRTARVRKENAMKKNVPDRQRAFALLASCATVCAIGLMAASPRPARADAIGTDVMLVNVQTNKCLTIAGGVSTENNVHAVQFDCDDDPSRRWKLIDKGGNVYQVRNVQTGKCLTIAGGTSTDNNVVALQFDCDTHPSRTWRITDVTGGGLHQLRNVQTSKCVTISGGISTANNVEALQFNCDTHPSRRWTIRLKL